MSTVIALPRGRPLTVDDLHEMPDDGYRYELVDGTLLVSPAPSRQHQRAIIALAVLLREATMGTSVEMLIAPFEVVLPGAVLQPDVIVARRDDLTDKNLPAAPVAAVEVLSPSSRSIDRNLKHARYAEAGVEQYWIVDPLEPSLTVWRLARVGTYDLVAHVMGDEAHIATGPVNVTVVPTALVDLA